MRENLIYKILIAEMEYLRAVDRLDASPHNVSQRLARAIEEALTAAEASEALDPVTLRRVADTVAEMARAEIDNAACSSFDERMFAEERSRTLRKAEAKVRALAALPTAGTT